VNLIEKNKEKVEQLASFLLEKEVIFSEDLEHIFGKRLFASRGESIQPVPVTPADPAPSSEIMPS
jgi:cell division protease FtsH